MEDEHDDIIDAEFTEFEVQVVDTETLLPSTELAEGGGDPTIDLEFEYARANLVNIIEKSNNVLDATAVLAVESEHPSVVNAYTMLIKNLADINKSLLSLRETKMKLKGEIQDERVPSKSSAAQSTNVTNNTIFVGSTEELLKAMKKG